MVKGSLLDLRDANVNSVIDLPTAKCVLKALTPSHSSRKRHLSKELIRVTKTKSKSDPHSKTVDGSERIIAHARRSLYGNTSAKRSKDNSCKASAHKDKLIFPAEPHSVNVDMLS